MDVVLIILYLLTLTVIGFLLYTALKRPERVKISQVMKELPPSQRFDTHWWGYGWRPWWRRYGGVPGFGPGTPLPEPKIPVPAKPIIIPNKLY